MHQNFNVCSECNHSNTCTHNTVNQNWEDLRQIFNHRPSCAHSKAKMQLIYCCLIQIFLRVYIILCTVHHLLMSYTTKFWNLFYKQNKQYSANYKSCANCHMHAHKIMFLYMLHYFRRKYIVSFPLLLVNMKYEILVRYMGNIFSSSG